MCSNCGCDPDYSWGNPCRFLWGWSKRMRSCCVVGRVSIAVSFCPSWENGKSTYPLVGQGLQGSGFLGSKSHGVCHFLSREVYCPDTTRRLFGSHLGHTVLLPCPGPSLMHRRQLLLSELLALIMCLSKEETHKHSG